MPELYIITGSNGAGKSTIGPTYLPVFIQRDYTVFDGDKLFILKQRELWRQGVRAVKEVKKIAYQFVSDTFDRLTNEALDNFYNFVYEGHFTNDATWNIPKKFKDAGYKINLLFFGLSNPDLSQLRVVDRVKEGGHYVDRFTIEDNFYGNLEKLNKYFTIIDNLTIVDTSAIEHRVLSNFIRKEVVSAVLHSSLPLWFKSFLPDIAEKIRLHKGG